MVYLYQHKKKVDKLIESEIQVYFGEVLGKHSEIFGTIKEEEITFVSDDQKFVSLIKEHDLTSGFNPFEYTSINYQLDGLDLDDMTVDDIVDELIKRENKVN